MNHNYNHSPKKNLYSLSFIRPAQIPCIKKKKKKSLNVHVDPVNSQVIIVQKRKIEKVVPISTNGVLVATPEQEAFQCRDMKTGRAG